MSILDRYVTREFMKMLTLGITALLLVSTVVDIFERIDDIIRHKPPLLVTFTFFLARIPQVLFMVVPISILITTLLVIGAFSRNSEIVAILANGVSIYRILVPMLVIGAVVSLLMFGLNEFIVPTANRLAVENKRIIQGKPDRRKMAKIESWFRGNEEKRIYYINMLIPEEKKIHRLTVFELNDQFIPVKRLDAEMAEYNAPQTAQKNGGRQQELRKFVGNLFKHFHNNNNSEEETGLRGTWTLYQGVERSLQDSEYSSTITFRERQDYDIPRTFDEFRQETKNPVDMNYRELKYYIQSLTASGYDVSKYIVDLRAKFSYPFVSLVMVIIGFPFALKSPRSGAAMGLGISVFIGFTYWVILQLGISLGHAQILPPLLAAWISHIIFAAAGFYLILSTRT